MEKRRTIDVVRDYIDACGKHDQREGKAYWKSRKREYADEFDEHIEAMVDAKIADLRLALAASNEF